MDSRCWNELCNNKPRFKCQRCLSAQYCGDRCQEDNWKIHFKVCSGNVKTLTSNGGSSAKAVSVEDNVFSLSKPITCESATLFTVNLTQLTVENDSFRRVVWTTMTQQLVLMRLRRGEHIGVETHTHTTQFIRVEKGIGWVVFGGGHRFKLEGDSAFMVQPGQAHNVGASAGGDGLWLYTIYSPPQHPIGLIQLHKSY